MRRLTTLILLALLIGPVFSQDTIPAARKIDWTQTGIPGGIPVRTTIHTTIDAATYGTGLVDATAVIQAALNACTVDQVVYLPAGTYLLTGSLSMPDRKTLRGAGPGLTTLKRSGADASQLLLFHRPVFWNDIIGAPDTRNITVAVKDATTVTVDDASGISIGDVLILNQLNSGDVTNIGHDGSNPTLCTYCGLANGSRSLGQMVEVTGVVGNVISIDVPLHWTYDVALTPWAYHIPSSHLATLSGVEDLTVTQDAATSIKMIFIYGAKNCWLKNIELTNIYLHGLFTQFTMRSEISHNYLHDSFGVGIAQGYGISTTYYSSNNRIENNRVANIGSGGIDTHGGASGNVIAYNYLYNITYSDPNWLIASPFLCHGAHPKMNLWEGNFGYKLSADIIIGSSSHNTVFRSQSKGWLRNETAAVNNAVELQKQQYYYNLVGNVLGTTGKSNRYEVIPGCAPPYDPSADNVIWALGVVIGGRPADANVEPTTFRDGNYDYFTDTTVWDAGAHALQASLYSAAQPAWWCSETPWPPIGPDVVGYVNKTPAQRRYEGLTCTCAGLTVAITAPTAAATYTTASSTIAIGGTTADTHGVASVAWANATTGLSGSCTGTTTWTSIPVALNLGANVITITGTDSYGNTSTDVITITYAPAGSTIYYVDNSCTNNGDGTTVDCAGAPGGVGAFNTGTLAFVVVTGSQPDKFVLFKKGLTYSETITITANGNVGHPFTMGTYGTGAKPIITGATIRDIGITTNSKSNVTISGFDVINCSAGDAGIVSSSSSQNIIIEDCDVHDNTDFGIGVIGTAADNIGTIIRRCNVYNNGTACASGLGSGILIMGTDATKRAEDTLIEDCNIYGNGTDNHDHGIYDEGYRTIMRYNRIWANKGFAIKCEGEVGGSGSQAYYNLLYQNVSGMLMTHFSGAPTNYKFWYNVLYANGSASPWTYGLQYTFGGGVPSGNEFIGNLVIGAVEPEARYFVLANGLTTGLTITNNGYYSTESEWWRINGANKTFAEWQALGLDAGAINADPLLTSPTDYHLLTGSPMIDAGVSVGLIRDYEGGGIGVTPDIGAYEFGDISPTGSGSRRRMR